MRLHFLEHDTGHFQVSVCGDTLVPLQANIPTLYALEDHVPRLELGTEGSTLVMSERTAASPLGLECFKHCTYLNTVFRTYPRHSTKAPALEGVPKPEDYEHHLNSLKNLPLFHQLNHVGFLHQAAQGSPALVIQPGPSFDPAFIRDLAGRCVTIAISRTLPDLLAHGIVPDIIYQQDTSKHSWNTCFAPLQGRRLDSALVANPVGPFHAYHRCFASLYKSWNFFPFEVDRMDHVIRCIAPSTTTGAFSLALHLGCAPVILHGGDFGSLTADPVPAGFGTPAPCFAEENGIQIFRPMPRFHHKLVLPLSGGRAIATSVDYLAASQWLKREALRLAVDRPDMKVLDRSGTGMLCESSVIAPFTPEALDGRTRRLELRRYAAPFSWTGFAREILRRYTAIRRILDKAGRTPDISMINPYNSLYTGMPQFTGKPFDLDPGQRRIALERADELIALLEALLNGSWTC